MSDSQHPIQPLEEDEHGRVRFKSNAIVRHLLDNGPFDMNALARMPFSADDREQFAQLIGYSLDGFGELSYVREETLDAATSVAGGADAATAREHALRTRLESVRDALREGVAILYAKHPDDLRGGA